MTMDTCVFCRILTGYDPATIVRDFGHAIAFVPLYPVAEGHVLVAPYLHVADAAEKPKVAGLTMAVAAELAREHEAANIITSIGAAATQTVPHLHLHVVPRRPGDGLALPWTGQISRGGRE